MATTFDPSKPLAGLPPDFVLQEGGYAPTFSIKLDQEEALSFIKTTFEDLLKENVALTRVSCPMFVTKRSGFNDNLNGVERPATFAPRDFQDIKLEVPFSLAKWKRWALVRACACACACVFIVFAHACVRMNCWHFFSSPWMDKSSILYCILESIWNWRLILSKILSCIRPNRIGYNSPCSSSFHRGQHYYEVKAGKGIVTDFRGLRCDDDCDYTHSVRVPLVH
jgi:Aspartate-ammonia ligase